MCHSRLRQIIRICSFDRTCSLRTMYPLHVFATQGCGRSSGTLYKENTFYKENTCYKENTFYKENTCYKENTFYKENTCYKENTFSACMCHPRLRQTASGTIKCVLLIERVLVTECVLCLYMLPKAEADAARHHQAHISCVCVLPKP